MDKAKKHSSSTLDKGRWRKAGSSGVIFLFIRLYTFVELHWIDIEKLLVAALLGAVIGLDRQYRGKPAGFRTLILVSMGAALFTIVSFRMAHQDSRGISDVTRIASNIVTGIGFLGAGLIFKAWGDVKGLTTSATVWVAAAVGMASGIGLFLLAAAATVIVWFTLFALHYVEIRADKLSSLRTYTVSWNGDTPAIDPGEFVAKGSITLKDLKLTKKDGLVAAQWSIKANRQTHDAIVKKLLADDRIISLEY